MRFAAFLSLALAPLLVGSQSVPRESIPIKYHLNIDVSDLSHESVFFNGSVQVDVSVLNPTKYIVLDAQDLVVNISSVTVSRSSRFGPDILEVVDDVINNGHQLNITFQQPIIISNYAINIDFQGRYQENMAGFAKIPFHFNKTLRHLAVTSLEPTNARRVFPCYDDPAHRTSFQLNITVSKAQMVLSNVKPTYIHNVTETTKLFHFDIPSLPVNKLGWVVMDQKTFLMHSSTTELNNTVHTRALYPYSNHTSWACELTSSLLDALSKQNQMPYPLSKLEQIVVPEFFTGTADGWGIISYSEEAILVTPERTSAQDTQQVALGLARGLVQQWTGSLVSMDSWDHSWLVTGLAEHLKYSISASLPTMTDWELRDQAVVEMVQPALALDMSQHALTVETHNEPAHIQTVYDDLTKYKGGAVIRMLYDILGDTVFNNAFAVYLKEKASSTSDPEDLWNILYEAARNYKVDLAMESVEDVMSKWTTVAGYPIISVAWNGTHFNISQPADSPWYVPITYSLQNNSNMVTRAWLLPGQSMAVQSGPQWILLNINQMGFYRVSYNSSLLERLSTQLTADLTQIPRLSRAQLIDDVFSLATSGAISSETLLQFTSYLTSETDYYPWHTALRNYQSLLDKLYGHTSYDLLKEYVLSLMKGVVAHVGMASKPQDSHVDKLRRSLVLEKACYLGHSACLQKASDILKSWMAATYFDADLNAALLCAGVSNISATNMWRNLWDMYDKSVFPTIKANILKALTCSRNETLMKEFLTNITSTSTPVVSTKDKTILLKTLASTPFGAELLLDWLVERLYAQLNTTTHPPNSTANKEAPGVNTTPTPPEGGSQLNSSGGSTNRVRRTVDNMVPEELLESDVEAILLYIAPKLTNIDQGKKLDAFAAQNNTGISNSTLQLMKKVTDQVYQQNNWTQTFNGKITVWLEERAAATTTGGSSSNTSPTPPPTSPPKPSGAAAWYASVALCLVMFTVQCSVSL